MFSPKHLPKVLAGNTGPSVLRENHPPTDQHPALRAERLLLLCHGKGRLTTIVKDPCYSHLCRGQHLVFDLSRGRRLTLRAYSSGARYEKLDSNASERSAFISLIFIQFFVDVGTISAQPRLTPFFHLL